MAGRAGMVCSPTTPTHSRSLYPNGAGVSSNPSTGPSPVLLWEQGGWLGGVFSLQLLGAGPGANREKERAVTFLFGGELLIGD